MAKEDDDIDDADIADKNLFKLCGLATLILIVPFVIFGVAHFVIKLNGIISGVLAIVSVIVFLIIGVRIAIVDSLLPSSKKKADIQTSTEGIM